MLRPKAFLFSQNHPRWTREEIKEGEGIKIFKNVINFVKNEL
jgi:hypothetical protein